MVKIQEELILCIQNERHFWNFIISYFSYFRQRNKLWFVKGRERPVLFSF